MRAVRHLDRARGVGQVLAQAQLGELVDHLGVALAVWRGGAQQLELARVLARVELVDVHQGLRLQREAGAEQRGLELLALDRCAGDDTAR